MKLSLWISILVLTFACDTQEDKEQLMTDIHERVDCFDTAAIRLIQASQNAPKKQFTIGKIDPKTNQSVVLDSVMVSTRFQSKTQILKEVECYKDIENINLPIEVIYHDSLSVVFQLKRQHNRGFSNYDGGQIDYKYHWLVYNFGALPAQIVNTRGDIFEEKRISSTMSYVIVKGY